jgi:hypothetical protein
MVRIGEKALIAIVGMGIATVLLASWRGSSWATHPSPPRPDPAAASHRAELVVVEAVSGYRGKRGGRFRLRVMLPSGDHAYVTTTELLPRGEHVLAEFAHAGDEQLTLYAYTRCGPQKCAGSRQ